MSKNRCGEGKAILFAHIPAEHKKFIDDVAKAKETPVSYVVRQIIKEFIQRHSATHDYSQLFK